MIGKKIKIPDGWKIKNLGELLSVVRNGTNDNQVNTVTNYPVTRIETIADGSIDFSKVGYVQSVNKLYKLENGDILISNINSVKHIGKVAFYESKLGDLYHGMNLLLLRFIDEYDKKFFYYCLIHKKSWFEKMSSQAVNQASINQNTIKICPLVFPQSKTEQSKIAEILSTVDEAIDKTEALIQKYRRIKQGLMQDLLTKGIDENGNIRSEKTHKFKDSPLGRIPEEWEVGVFADIALINPPKPKIDDENITVTFLPMEYLSEEGGIIKKREVQYVQVKNGYTCFEEKDVLFAKITPCMENGKGALAIGLKNGLGCGSTEFHILRAKNNSNSVFIYQYSINKKVRQAAKNNMTGTAGQQRVSSDFFKKYQIVIPKLPEQSRIASILSQSDEAIQKEEAYKQKLLSLKRGLMEDLLTGRVRVNSLFGVRWLATALKSESKLSHSTGARNG